MTGSAGRADRFMSIPFPQGGCREGKAPECAPTGTRRITGSAGEALDVGWCVRKLLKWEEVQEEGRWTVARDRRAGGFMLIAFLNS